MNQETNPKGSAISNAISPAIAEWNLYQKQCTAFIASGFLPDHITKTARSPQEAIARAVTIAWKGRELGIPILQSFSSITVINGKPCLSAELMLALCYKHVPEFKATIASSSTECSVTMQRKGGEAQEFKFSLEDAKRAGLVRPNSPWEKYPSAMLRARAISAAARAVCPDAIMGCYTVEELGGPVIEGEIVEAAPLRQVETVQTTQTKEASKPPVQQHPGFVITQKQASFLMAKAKEYGFNESDVDAMILDEYGLDSKKKLTRTQMDETIEFMRSEWENGGFAPETEADRIAAMADGSVSGI
jgi:hypothetical protein